MSKKTISNRPEWSNSPTIGMVEEDLTLRSEHVLGPTLYNRESEFGRGIASADRTPTWYTRSRRAFCGARSGLLFCLMLTVSAIALVGCGGGDTPATDASGAATDPNAAGTTPTDPNVATGGTPTADGTTPTDGTALTGNTASGGATEIVAPGSQVKTSAQTPKAFVNAIGRQTILVFISTPTAHIDQLLTKEVNTALHSVKGVAFFSYGAGDHQGYQDIPQSLNMYGSPSVAIVDRSGAILNYWTGYVDSTLLIRSLQRANAATPAKVKPTDVPSAGGGDSSLAPAAPSGNFDTGF